mgnify:CR=1
MQQESIWLSSNEVETFLRLMVQVGSFMFVVRRNLKTLCYVINFVRLA